MATLAASDGAAASSEGVAPASARQSRSKWLWSAYPAETAMSAIRAPGPCWVAHSARVSAEPGSAEPGLSHLGLALDLVYMLVVTDLAEGVGE